MANLIIQDTFDPYYAGRDENADARETHQLPAARQPKARDGEIILPTVPLPVATIRRRDRRAVAH